MPSSRRYQLLCPVARSLDVLGDRWSLLILRDLHAGPARFQELHTGLGIATNLLTDRLGDLQAAGLVERASDATRAPYQLTERGRTTDRVLWELVRFGAGLDRDPQPRPPGNLRTLVLPLRMMLGQIPTRPAITARLIVDTEAFVVDTTGDDVTIAYADTISPVEVELQTDYVGLLDVAEGLIEPDAFAAHHVEILAGADRAPTFLGLMAEALGGS